MAGVRSQMTVLILGMALVSAPLMLTACSKGGHRLKITIRPDSKAKDNGKSTGSDADSVTPVDIDIKIADTVK
jgi:hypothetical protein